MRRRGCGGSSGGALPCWSAGSTRTRRTSPPRASSRAGAGPWARWPRGRDRTQKAQRRHIAPSSHAAVRSEAVEANPSLFFNMSRTLSIGNEGPRAVTRPWPYLSWPEFPLTARVGSTPVWQFNIRPSRRMRRCISLLRPAPPVRLSCDVRGGFAAARKTI